ncbi:intraflagellar transport protein 140 homolog [Penaeus indicus]
MFPGDGETGIRELQDMLMDPNIEAAVRQGDIYATIIEYYVSNNNFKSAVSSLQDMKNRLPKANPSYYIDAQALQSIARATGVNVGGIENGIEEGGSEDEGNASEEEVVEEDEEDIRPQRHFALNGSAKFL